MKGKTMKSLEVIAKDNDDAVMDAIEDESRPIIERVDMWLDHPNRDLSLACDLLIKISAHAKDLESKIATLEGTVA